MQKGENRHHGICKSFSIRNCENVSRLGLIVGKKVGNAPSRNRWKRLLKEAFRLERGRFSHPLDVVILVKGKKAQMNLHEIQEMFRSLSTSEER